MKFLNRHYHDATEGFLPTVTVQWQLVYPDKSKHEVICHNDAALYNVVFQNESPVALIDFDMAGPGPRMHENEIQFITNQLEELAS